MITLSNTKQENWKVTLGAGFTLAGILIIYTLIKESIQNYQFIIIHFANHFSYILTESIIIFLIAYATKQYISTTLEDSETFSKIIFFFILGFGIWLVLSYFALN